MTFSYPIKITYRLTEPDYRAAYELFAAHEPSMRRASRRVLPWLGVLITLLPLASLIKAPHENRGLAVITLLFGIYMVYCGFALKLYFRKLYRSDSVQHDCTAVIDEEGVHVVTPDSDSRLEWSSYVRILESERIFMLFHSAWIFNIVPKSAFSPGEMEAFRELAYRKIAVHT